MAGTLELPISSSRSKVMLTMRKVISDDQKIVAMGVVQPTASNIPVQYHIGVSPPSGHPLTLVSFTITRSDLEALRNAITQDLVDFDWVMSKSKKSKKPTLKLVE
jgi:hypothetical protein